MGSFDETMANYEKYDKIVTRLRDVLYDANIRFVAKSDGTGIELVFVSGNLTLFSMPFSLSDARKVLKQSKEAFENWATQTGKDIDDADSSS